VGTRASQYSPSLEVSLAPPTPNPSELESRQSPELPPAVTHLVSNHKPTSAGGECTKEAATLVVATGSLLGSLGGLVVAAPTLIGEIPAILKFIGSAAAVGAAAATYANCKDEAAAKSEAK
jgi:hypothetical protein